MTDQCRALFLVKGRKRYYYRCDLKQDHLQKYHEHEFRNWTARVWRIGKPRFSYVAKPGRVLPKDVSR